MTHPNDTPQPQDHLPDACYPCAIEECALEHTWPAHELHLAHVMLAPSDRETLEEVMKRQERSAA